MKNSLRFSLLFLLIFGFLNSAFAEEQKKSFENLFQDSVAALQKKNLDAARQSLEEALKIQPDNSTAKLNLSILAYEQKQKGLALGLARSLVEQDSRNEKAHQILRFIEKSNPPKAIPHQSKFLEELHQEFLIRMDLNSILLTITVILLFAGITWLRFLKQRITALKEESTLPSFPWIASLLTFLLFGFMILGTLKAVDAQVHRGTILGDETPVLSAPDANTGIELLKLNEGLEVHILEAQNEYMKVEYPGTSAGWVKKEQVYSH